MAHTTLQAANVVLMSFSGDYTKITPHYEFDLNQFRDPMHKFRDKRGRDAEVQSWISTDVRLPAIIGFVKIMVSDVIDKQAQGWIAISFRDYHGRWKSEAVTELVADALERLGYKVHVFHSLTSPLPVGGVC